MLVRELLETLEGVDPEAEVRVDKDDRSWSDGDILGAFEDFDGGESFFVLNVR